ncbi:hypothetical protein BCR44DRAFT_59201 [Catenaria anguillulae PL171]|uniref:Uncharacterized protein n=1 Tax=Catenaria anguillulae PL171 TaxID=765915 RepID=A0A1Y2HTA4_9FUNG|nr:hypothetical protein BCR44DRAFT_59201 [Catenaria anguillulae PL171]
MFVGMCFPSVSRTTAYFAPNPREPYVFYATTRFSVFMSNSKLGTTSLNEPAPNLFWLPSPDLSGREYLKGILQLVTVSSGQSQDATPIVRQQLNVAVPPLSGLGTGAYFIHSAPPLGSSATGSQDAHAKAVLRTEYLYIAINPNMHCTLARQQNFHTAVTPRPSYPVAPDQAPSTEYYAKCAQDSDDDMFAKRRTRPQQVQCDPLPGPTRASSESIQSFSPCVSSPIGEIESNMQVSQVASSCHSINSSAQVAQVSSQQSASLSRPWQESNEAVQALSYTASASVAETKCSTTPSVQLASVESVCPMAQSSSIPIDDAQDDLGETRLSRIEVVNCGTQTQDISYATPEARAAAWTTEGNGSLISRESRTEIVQSSHGCRCSQATQCDMGLAAPAVQDDGMMFTDIRNQAEIPQMLRCASQDSEQFQENTLPVLVSADASPVLVRMESSPCYERPMHMAESAVRILTPTVTSSSHNLVPTVPSVVDDEVGLE